MAFQNPYGSHEPKNMYGRRRSGNQVSIWPVLWAAIIFIIGFSLLSLVWLVIRA